MQPDSNIIALNILAKAYTKPHYTRLRSDANRVQVDYLNDLTPKFPMQIIRLNAGNQLKQRTSTKAISPPQSSLNQESPIAVGAITIQILKRTKKHNGDLSSGQEENITLLITV